MRGYWYREGLHVRGKQKLVEVIGQAESSFTATLQSIPLVRYTRLTKRLA